MAEVTYREASRIYPGTPGVRAVDRLDLTVGDGEFLVLVGPSGSGKSTALRMVAGLEDLDEGTILIGGRDVTAVPPKDRDIAMVFQSYALYPHMTVAQNMGFALKLRGTAKSRIAGKVAQAAKLLDLTGLLDRKPKELSGGQRQRVAMGRAIVREPSVFLMDEPLSNLDAKLRVETRANIAALQQRLGTTTIYVTHDQVEAMTMGHRVAVLSEGMLQQCAIPRELYNHPVNTFVAGFIGSPAMNLATVPLAGDGPRLDGLALRLSPAARAALGDAGTVTVGIRPETLHLTTGEGMKLMVELVEELGADAYLHGSVRHHGRADRVVVRVDGRTPPLVGQSVTVGLRRHDDVHYFHPRTGERLPE